MTVEIINRFNYSHVGGFDFCFDKNQLTNVRIHLEYSAAMFWIAKLYSSEDPNSPKFLIINLIVDNRLYLNFLLDPFVYAWRIPKYRQALMIVLRCGKEKPERSKFSNRVIAEMDKSRETVITLDFKQISNF